MRRTKVKTRATAYFRRIAICKKERRVAIKARYLTAPLQELIAIMTNGLFRQSGGSLFIVRTADYVRGGGGHASRFIYCTLLVI